ncbi:MAG: SIS domain-containing protein [SAR324 cluster bacterium]|nr:SIS domain-containing protein [SAR324 cluster bacterium]
MRNRNRQKNDFLSFQGSIDIIFDECRQALSKVDPIAVEYLIEAILSAEKVFFVGVGRVLLSLQAIAKRFSHLGIHTCYVGQITEPAITNRDLLIVGSGSGESLIPVAIAKKAKIFGVKIVHIGSNSESSLKGIADIFIRVPVRTKLAMPDEINSRQPMTSLFEQCLLVLGDALAMMIVLRQELDMKSLWCYHANLE